ncbi:MAG: NAD-dependent epimerase/dehydratase family protein [Acidobacteria bacterium]|nr:NAD-dependent epimerase/dehydratase family protein [Acidobacteriota bacterium]
MTVFVTGGTGYLGRPLIEQLTTRGHQVKALVRPGSEKRLPAGATPVLGDALNAETFTRHVKGADTLVQLAGTPKPAPWKGPEFHRVDRASAYASIAAAKAQGVPHFVYVSVAHPAPVMKSYIAVRTGCENLLRTSGLRATVLRPWYVLGPGHWWPYALIPFYALGAMLPFTREGAARLGLVRREEMVRALVWAVESPAPGWRVLDVPAIRAFQSGSRPATTPVSG